MIFFQSAPPLTQTYAIRSQACLPSIFAYRKVDLEGTVAQEAGVKCYTGLHGKKDLGWQMENGREMTRRQRKRRNQSPQAVRTWNSPLMMTKINLAG